MEWLIMLVAFAAVIALACLIVYLDKRCLDRAWRRVAVARRDAGERSRELARREMNLAARLEELDRREREASDQTESSS